MHSSLGQDAEFRWEKHYHGARYQNLETNKIHGTLFDSAGNVYVFGEAGWGAQIDGENIGTDGMAGSCLFVAKFDTLGNKVWLKSMAESGGGCPFFGYNMYLRNDKVIIGFQKALDAILTPFDSIVLFDTTFYTPWPFRISFPFGQVLTFFVSFDLDGNMLDYHFLKLMANDDAHHDIPITDVDFFSNYYTKSLTQFTRFVFDSQGNICLFASCPEVYWDSIDHPYFIIDDDSTTCFPLDFSPYSDRQHQISASFFLKIDTNWHIVKQKFLVDSTENWPAIHYQLGDVTRSKLCSLEPRRISIDENDNIYFSGYYQHLGYGDSIDISITYPYYVYLDSMNYFKIEGFWSGVKMPIVIKFSANGDILWCNQLYLRNERQNVSSVGKVAFDSNMVFVSLHINDTIFFDEYHTIKLDYHDVVTSFLTIYDKNTGCYIGHIQYDTLTKSEIDCDITIRNNMLITSYLSLDPYYQFGPEYATDWLVKIDLNTMQMSKTTPIYASPAAGPFVHPQGYLLRTAHDDDIHGNDFDMNNTTKEMALLFFYDSTLDERRERACPATLSFEASLQQGNRVLCSWDAEDTSATWELAYTSDSANWASATMLLVNGSDTTILLDGSGCYHFRVRRVCDWGKRGAWSATTTICATEGIDSPGRQSRFCLSPNPANGVVHVVDSHGDPCAMASVTLFSMQGKEMLAVESTDRFDASSLPSGSYIAKLRTAQGEIFYLKLIVIQ
ncbi:MAG: T9SS type A sorting domain-containing protein [Bacteroidales bacterium]|nr:T9SS type A sorting domain-containing protein [Bacteroidales bacterium]